MNYLGDKLRTLRESQGLLLRQAAAFVEVDTAFLSKVERGEKKASKEQVIKLSEFLKAQPNDLLILWLADRITDVVEKDSNATQALKLVLKNLKAS